MVVAQAGAARVEEHAAAEAPEPLDVHVAAGEDVGVELAEQLPMGRWIERRQDDVVEIAGRAVEGEQAHVVAEARLDRGLEAGDELQPLGPELPDRPFAHVQMTRRRRLSA